MAYRSLYTLAYIKQLLRIFPFLIFSTLLTAAESPEQSSLNNWYGNYQNNSYVIQIPASKNNIEKLHQRMRLFNQLIIYIPRFRRKGDSELILKVGFFSSQDQAQDFIDASNFIFSNLTVLKIDSEEHKNVLDLLQQKNTTHPAYFIFPVRKQDEATSADFSTDMLNTAKNLYLDKRYKLALGYYQLLSILADKQTAIWAKELSGLCYEKLNDMENAKSTYQNLIEIYPDAPSISRVEQRLRAILTANDDGKQALRGLASNDSKKYTFFRGDFSQYHHSLDRSINGGNSLDVLSAISTNFDLRAAIKTGSHNIKGRINGFHIKDQLDNENSEFRLNRSYLDYYHDQYGFRTVLGRQKNYDSGVFTSFDGISLSYPLKNNLKLSTSIGNPVYFADAYDGLDYFFYSLFTEWNINPQWQLNTYLINQTLNQVTDRKAIGLRASYYNPKITSSLNLDYDQAYSEINNILLNTSYLIKENLNFNLLYGKQRSPFLSAANILIGQADLDLNIYLQSQINRDTLLEDALARTSLNTYFSLAINFKLNDKRRFIVDYYQSNLSEIPTQEVLTGIPSSQTDISAFSQNALGIQFLIDDAFSNYDSISVGLRSSESPNSTALLLFVNDRIRFNQRFFVNPKISYSVISYDAQRDDQNQLRYSLSLGYRPFKNSELNLEWGNESISVLGERQDFKSNYLYFGYRVHF